MILRSFAFFLTAVSGLAAADASQAFAQYCGICHGTDGGGTDRGPALLDTRRLRGRSEAEIARTIRTGTPGGMPAVPLPIQSLAKRDSSSLCRANKAWNGSPNLNTMA